MGLWYVESRKKMWISLWIIWKNPWMEMNPMLWIMVENVENGLRLSDEALESLEDGENGILTLLRIRLETGRHAPDPGPVCIQGPAAFWGPEIRQR